MNDINGPGTSYVPPPSTPLPGSVEDPPLVQVQSTPDTTDSGLLDELLTYLSQVTPPPKNDGTQDLDPPKRFTAAELDTLLGQWADKVGKVTTESMINSLEQQMASIEGNTKSQRTEVKTFYKKQAEQLAAAASKKMLGWLTTIGTLVAATVALVAASAAAAATGGLATPAVAFAAVGFAAAVTDLGSKIDQENGGKGFSLGGLCAEGLEACGVPHEQAQAFGPALLGGPAGVLGVSAGEIAKAAGANPEEVAIVTAVVTIVATGAMVGAAGKGPAVGGAGGAGAAGQGANAAQTAQTAEKAAASAATVQRYAKIARSTGEITSAGGTIGQGVVQNQMASVTEDIAEGQARVKELEGEQANAQQKFDQSLEFMNEQMNTQNKVQTILAQVRRARQQSMQQVAQDIAA